MVCRCAPALDAALHELDALAPDRDRSSDGCCGDAAHAERVSDHNPVDGVAHARDFDEDTGLLAPPGQPASKPLWWLWCSLADDPDERVKYVIYERGIMWPNSPFSASPRDPGTWEAHGNPRKYVGLNAHEKHQHWSICQAAGDDTSSWRLAERYAASFPTTVEEAMGSGPFVPHVIPTADSGRVKGYTLDVENQNLIGWNGARIGWDAAWGGQGPVDFMGMHVLSLKQTWPASPPITHLGVLGAETLVLLSDGDGGTFKIPMA